MVDIGFVIGKNNDLCEVCLLQDRKVEFTFIPPALIDHVVVGQKYVVQHNRFGKLEFAVKGGCAYG